MFSRWRALRHSIFPQQRLRSHQGSPASSCCTPSSNIISTHINDCPLITRWQRTSAAQSRSGTGLINGPRPVALQLARLLSFLWRPMGDHAACGRTGVTPTFHHTLVRSLPQRFAGGRWVGGQCYPIGSSTNERLSTAWSSLHQWFKTTLGGPLFLACHASLHGAKGPTWIHVTAS